MEEENGIALTDVDVRHRLAVDLLVVHLLLRSSPKDPRYAKLRCMTTVTRLQGIAGAAQATGATIVIDTFRAFTTAAVMFDVGVERNLLTDGVEEARRLAASHGALLCGEVGGVRPDGFDIGNSPFEVLGRSDMRSATVVQRTSSGTRSVIAALDHRAAPVFAASAVVAGATARATSGASSVAIVSAGQNGVHPSVEDDLTAIHIAALLEGTEPPEGTGAAIATCERARVRLR